jgi:hypothetical protein
MGMSDEMTIEEVLKAMAHDAHQQIMGAYTYSPVHMQAAVRFLRDYADITARLERAEALQEKAEIFRRAELACVLPGAEKSSAAGYACLIRMYRDAKNDLFEALAALSPAASKQGGEA